MTGQKKLTSLWLRQKKRCPCCSQYLTLDTGWEVHHLVERYRGGGDELDNLVMLHPNCHRQVHVTGHTVPGGVK